MRVYIEIEIEMVETLRFCVVFEGDLRVSRGPGKETQHSQRERFHQHQGTNAAMQLPSFFHDTNLKTITNVFIQVNL